LKEKHSWIEDIRKRPALYIGSVNQKGVLGMLKLLVSEITSSTNCDSVKIVFKENLQGEIEFENIQNEFYKDIAIIQQDRISDFMELAILNGLSKQLTLILDSSQKEKQEYLNGKSNLEPSHEKINCKKMNITFSLDESIWGKSFKWNTNYLIHELREFCYFFPTVKFEISETITGFSNINTFKFKNGLQDRLEIEILNGILSAYFNHHFSHESDNFKLEIAFAFRKSDVDQTFIRTYVNKEITPENGSHLDGLLNGLTDGVIKYFQANNLLNNYKISESDMKKGLVCIMNIELNEAKFRGAVKNKLTNSEIVKPISSFVSNLFYNSIQEDKESTQLLIHKFKTHH